MNYTAKQIDDLNLQLGITVEKADFEPERQKKLKEFRRNADIRGFRKGMAPMGLIEKLYGGSAMSDAINGTVTSALNKYIDDNKLNVLGEPLPAEDAPANDWEKEGPYTFTFDIALSPDLDINISEADKVTEYAITVTEKAKESYRSSMLKQFGTMEEVEKAGADDVVVADFQQGEEKVENAYVALRSLEDMAKDMFVGKKKGDSFDINVVEAFKNESDRAAMLNMSKEELASKEPVWTLTVKEVKSFKDAEPTQEVFDRMFGADTVHNEEEFMGKIAERLREEYQSESEYRLGRDIRTYLLDKTAIRLPEAFMKRWVFEANEGKVTKEEIEKEFDGFLEDFRWQMIRNWFVKNKGLKVEKEDLQKEAMWFAQYQFSMYGMNDVPADTLSSYAESILKDQQQAQRLYDKVMDDKVINFVKGVISFEKKRISVEKFRELK